MTAAAINGLALFGFAIIIGVALYLLLLGVGYVIANDWYNNKPAPDFVGYPDKDALKMFLCKIILRLRIMVGILLVFLSFAIAYIILFVEES